MNEPRSGSLQTVSVVIPCRNGASYLRECLESVVKQTVPPLEILVGDDGSTDDSAAIAKDFGAEVIAVEGPVHCAAAARNVGLRRSRGAFIALLDADDIWKEHHLETQLELLRRFPQTGLSFSRLELFGDINWIQEEWLPPEEPVDAYWLAVRKSSVLTSGVVMRRHVIETVGLFDESLRLVEDYDFFARVTRAFPIVCSAEITARYRKYATQSSRSMKLCREIEFALRRKWYEDALRKGLTEEASKHESALREAFESYLELAWATRNSQLLRIALSLHAHIPKKGHLMRKWVPRIALMPLLKVWDRLPDGIRAAIKRS